MSEQIVSSKAKWVLQELIPVILTLGIGLLSLFLCITEKITLAGSVIGMVAGFGLMLYLLFENGKRKRRSTLFAKVSNNDKHTLSVWMRKPNKDKWKGRLDEGKNSGDLNEATYVAFESVMGTNTVVVTLNKNKKLYIPVRLIEDNDTVRLYIVDAIADAGEKVKFKSKKDSEDFATLLVGSKIEKEKKTEKVVAQPSEEWKREGRKTVEKAEYAKSEPVEEKAAAPKVDLADKTEEVKPVAAPVAKNVQATQVVGYDRYKAKSVEEKVDDAINAIDIRKSEADQKKAREDNARFDADSLLFPGNSVSSVSVDIKPEDKK